MQDISLNAAEGKIPITRKPLYFLLNEEFYRLLLPLLTVCAFNMSGQLLLIAMATRSYSNVTDRYESFYARSGCILLFMINLACVIGLFALHFYRHYWSSKSIYTLMTLPLKRSRIYLVFFISYTLGLALYLLFSILAAIAGYSLFATAQMRVDGGRYLMHNGLYLAFVRSNFLRLLAPLSVESFISSLVLWLSIPVTILFTVISERSQRYRNLFITGTILVLMIYTITRRLSGYSTLPWTMAILAVSCLCIIKSLRIIKRNGITG